MFFVLFVPSVLYAQNESPAQPNNNEKRAKPQNEFLRINKSASDEIGKAADKIDKNISPDLPGVVEKNKTQVHIVLGGDFADNGDIKTNFRYGAQLHLPRFERYWKVKFANQDEKRDRGQGTVTRQQRTRNSNDDIFLGVSFSRNWDGIDVDYKPQIAFSDGLGLDHSIEADTEYKFKSFSFKPSLEFFANHDEGNGSSAAIRTVYGLSKAFSLEQSNDGRFVFITSKLSVTHSVGVAYNHNDRFGLSLNYFRSFNHDVADYRLTAYGYYLTSTYQIYKDILSLEVRPYVVFEREVNFKQTNGVVINTRVNF